MTKKSKSYSSHFKSERAETVSRSTSAGKVRFASSGLHVGQHVMTGSSKAARIRPKYKRIRDSHTIEQKLRLARVTRKAEDVFKNSALAENWLGSPNPELENESPTTVILRSEDGARTVENILGRIEYGVFS